MPANLGHFLLFFPPHTHKHTYPHVCHHAQMFPFYFNLVSSLLLCFRYFIIKYSLPLRQNHNFSFSNWLSEFVRFVNKWQSLVYLFLHLNMLQPVDFYKQSEKKWSATAVEKKIRRNGKIGINEVKWFKHNINLNRIQNRNRSIATKGKNKRKQRQMANENRKKETLISWIFHLKNGR